MKKDMIENALREPQGRVSGPTGAAAKLGIPQQTLESKIRKLGIDRYPALYKYLNRLKSLEKAKDSLFLFRTWSTGRAYSEIATSSPK